MLKYLCAVLTSTAALSMACAPACAQSTGDANTTKLPPLVVTKDKNKNKAKRPADDRRNESATATVPSKPPSIRDTRADTQGTHSYSAAATTAASKEPREFLEVPQTVSVITRQQMEDQNLNSAWAALAFAPGVQLVSNNPDQGQYYSRGYALNTAVDGVPVYNSLSGYRLFNTAIYDRIEVLQGPDGLFLGSGSNPTGVVNFVHKRPTDDVEVGWSTSYGSWNQKHGDFDFSTPLNEAKTIRFRGVIEGNDQDYYFDHAHQSNGLGYGVLEADLTKSTLLTLSTTEEKYYGPSYAGLPAWNTPPNPTNPAGVVVPAGLVGHFTDLPISTNVYPSWASMHWDTQEYNASLEQKLGSEWRVKVSTRLQEQSQHFNDAYPTTGVYLNSSGVLSANYNERNDLWDYERLGVDAYAQGPVYLFGQKHELLFGYNYDRFDTTDKTNAKNPQYNVPVLDPNSLAQLPLAYNAGGETLDVQSGYYGQARVKLLDPLTVILGARVTDFNAETRNLAPSPITPWVQGAHAEDHFTPYAAAIFDVTKNIAVYASYSDIFIPQTNLTFSGTPLPAREGEQYEVGVKGEFLDKRLRTSLSAFYLQDVNRAVVDATNSTPSQTYYLALGKAVSEGVDAQITGKLLPGLDLIASYDYLYTVLATASSYQGQAISLWLPKHMFKFWAKYQFQQDDWNRWSVGAGVLAQSNTLAGYTDQWAQFRAQDPYAVVNAQIGYQIEKDLSLTLNVNNIFNQLYYTRLGGTNTYNTPGDPRNFMLTLRRSFSPVTSLNEDQALLK